jgi:hypothetical protein
MHYNDDLRQSKTGRTEDSEGGTPTTPVIGQASSVSLLSSSAFTTFTALSSTQTTKQEKSKKRLRTIENLYTTETNAAPSPTRNKRYRQAYFDQGGTSPKFSPVDEYQCYDSIDWDAIDQQVC